MRIDPRLLEQSRKYAEARAAYDVHIKQFAHPVQWPLLSAEKQKEWYDGYMSK